jgi:hypothetical protein
MLTFLRSRTRGQLITLVVAVLAAIVAVLVVLALPAGTTHAVRSSQATRSETPVIADPDPAAASTSPPASPDTPLAHMLPRTGSADAYAAAVATALWDVDYASTPRDALLAFWRAQLASVLPAGTPAGTTLAQAQGAALSTITDYLPSAPMWSTLAHDRTVSSFTVTGVSEPPSWVEAVSSGKIADPGLTARDVIGVQKITYGTGTTRRTTAQTQQLIIAMLCPPTTAWCSVEVFPPRDTSGVSG